MFFVNQKKHKVNGTWENGSIVKETKDEAMHQYYAFMSTYAYGQDATVDYTSASVETETGAIIINAVDNRMSTLEPEN